MFLGTYAATDRWRLSSPDDYKRPNSPLLVILVILMPICFAVGMGKSLRTFDMDQASRSLAEIQSTVDPFSSEDGEVLFISQRHLLTFGMVEGVEIIPEYETVFLMEMAMSRNRDYLDQFHQDLRNRKFDLIVVDRLSTQIQARDHNFAEENNAWVEEISMPILCYYVPLDEIPDVPLQFFIPADGEDTCNY
jgi:hypothetical protein